MSFKFRKTLLQTCKLGNTLLQYVINEIDIHILSILCQILNNPTEFNNNSRNYVTETCTPFVLLFIKYVFHISISRENVCQ